MNEQNAIELLKAMQSPLQDYADMVGAPAWAYGCQYAYPTPEDYAIEDAITALKEKQGRKWILTEEQLPKEPGDYWVTMRHLNGTLTTEKYTWKPEQLCEDAWREVVVAWQPYFCPQPYNGKSRTGTEMEIGNIGDHEVHDCKRQRAQLPAGKTCADCAYIEQCVTIGGKPENTICKLEPNKFKEIPCTWYDRQKKGCEEWCGLPFC